MQIESQPQTAPWIRSLPLRRFIRRIILAGLFVTAFGVRRYNIKELPLQFHPVRQYRSAFIARWYYYQGLKSLPEWKKQVAALARQREGMLEPPILEHAAALAYSLVGKERLWIPRMLSSVFWLVGGAFLYLLAKNVSSENAALLSLAFYLLLPYGVLASRSFLPDPLMVMMLVVSIYRILLYYDEPSSRRFVLGAMASALAILIKPMCLFMIVGTCISLAICRQGLGAAIKSPSLRRFAVIVLLPGLIYYAYGVATWERLRYQALGSFYPHLFLVPTYWENWFKTVDRVVGASAFIIALLGLLLFREGLPRALALGLWSGYFLFGLFFNYHIHTHDYYQLQLIPLVALSLGPFADAVLKPLSSPPETRGGWCAIQVIVLVLAAGFALGSYVRAVWPPLTQIDRDPVTIAEEIGERVRHSTHTLFLSYANGQILAYHGELFGISWPWESDLQTEKRWGQPSRAVEARFNELVAKYSPEFFIVTEMGEFERRADLKNFLTKNFPVLVRSDRYLIFDLRKKGSPSPQAELEDQRRP